MSVDHIPVGAPITTVVTVQLSRKPNDPPLLANGLNLLRLDTAGRSRVLGVMHDDGQAGDVTAGDDIFTLRVTLNETAAGRLRLRATAAFKGQSRRVQSGVTSIPIIENVPPVANAGPGQTVFVGTTVQLDGSASSDMDGQELRFEWSFVAVPTGSTATLSDPTAVKPTFVVDRPGQYRVQLVVSDGVEKSTADIVIVSTTNSKPVANAGPDQTVPVGLRVFLDGRESHDVDGDLLQYRWQFASKPDGSTTTLDDATTAQPSFIVDKPGSYTIQLIVNDGNVDSDLDTVVINTQNSQPVANAGPDQTVKLGDTVQLDGSGSNDADNDPLTHAWSFTQRPDNSTAALSDDTAQKLSFIADKIGLFVVQLIVNDGKAKSAPDTTSITVQVLPPPNHPPKAIISAPATVKVGDTVMLDGSASNDQDGDPLTFTWSFALRPANSSATFSDPKSAKPSFVADVKGTYTVQLVVNDGKVDNNPPSPTATIQANEVPPPPPDVPFTLTAAPSSADVIVGQTISYALTLKASDTPGFAQLAALSVSGLPAGVTASFKPQQIAVGQTALLTISASASQTPTSASLKVTATATVNGKNVSQEVPVTLTILPITTSFLGRTVVNDALQTPLAGVTVTLLGVDGSGKVTGCNGQTVSDAAGNFMFTNLPAACIGGQLIRYDGTTATSPPGDYAGVDLFYTIVVDKVVVSPVLIHLPRLDDKETVCVQQDAPVDQIFTFKTIPNLSTTVYAHTTFTPHPQYPPPVGKCPAGQFPLIAINVPIDRLPDEMPPDPNSVMPFIVAYQPPNAVASQPVAVAFPNLLNNTPGTPMKLSTLDPTKGVMVIYGTGTVSPDGTQVIPDLDPAHPGHRFGLVHFDWHGWLGGSGQSSGPSCSKSKCCASKGKPIDLATGITFVRETDIAVNGSRGVISLTRMLQSKSTQAGPFGVGSNHNYSYFLNTNAPSNAAVINLVMPDRNQFPFVRQPNGTLINTTIPTLPGAVMTIVTDGTVQLRWKDGTIFRFLPRGFDLGFAASTLESITDPNGNMITLVREPNRTIRITEIIDPVGRKLALSYDAANRITTITDPIGRMVTYTYNAQGKLETVTDPEGGVTQYNYDAQNRLIRETDARGIIVAQNTYDANGRVIEQIQADGGVLKFAYTLANPSVADSPVLKTIFTDALGRQTIYRFDPQGFLLDVTDPLGQTRIFGLDPATNQLTILTGKGTCESCGNPSSGDMSFTYDANGNVLTQTDAFGHTTTFTYEPVFNKVESITNPLLEKTSFSYDSYGNLLKRIDANGHTTSFSYNNFGLLTEITDPLSQQSKFSYDSFGNLISITDPLSHTTALRYDAISRQAEATDALNRKSSTTYDKLSRVVEQTNAKGDKTKFTYDQVGNVRKVTDARNSTTEFTYDDMKRLKSKKTPLGKTDTRSYDFNGNLLQFTDRRGLTSSYTYDVLDRLVKETYADSSVERTYDANSRLIRANDSVSGASTFSYDLAGNTTSATSPVGSVHYSRDSLGRVESLTAGQAPVQYQYDPVGNLTKAALPKATVDFAYDARDQLTALTRSNKVTSTYDYDPVGRVLSLTHAKGATALNKQTYAYDAVGNRTSYETNIAQPLITQPVANSQYDDDNKLTSNSNKNFTYDDNGNLTSEGTSRTDTTTYTWDSRNRLKSLALPNGQTINFLYDFAGNLIRKSVSGTSPSSQEFVLDELTNIAFQKNSDDSQFSILTGQGIDSHLAVVGAGGQVDFGLTDTINSTTATTDQNGTLGPQFFYEPFGQTTTNSDYPFQFTGRVPVTNSLYYYRARFYNPTMGRFVSEDPIGFQGQDENLYRYVKNNSVNLIDPSGLTWARPIKC